MPFDRAHIIKKLLEAGLVTRDTVSRVLFMSRCRQIDVLKVLVNYAGMQPEDIRRFAAEHFGLITIDLGDIVLDPEVVRLAPVGIALEHRMIPAFRVSSRTHLAVSNPFDFEGLNRIKHHTGRNSDIFLASEHQVVRAIKDYCSRNQME